MLKAELRKIYKLKRKSLKVDERGALDEAILHTFQTLDFSKQKYIHCYLPIQSQAEPDTLPIIQWLQRTFPHIHIVVSTSDMATHTMQHFLYESTTTTLQPNAWGIPEPKGAKMIEIERIDVVLVPLLIFDRQGNRLGYGKGFYDRFLASCRSDIRKIGISYFDPIEKISDVDPYDVALDSCVTPFQIYHFD